ncbi:hypothetical protein [Paraliobacillus ryukyuensis]|uniref:hypothetical protein n=1 Tax=Paraliobacillus ryukyuensis TaxID=200904 RepID=UPI0015C45AE6|nr:hypothetical protein [Paraliobacillus ryukyuensis]
MKILIKVNTVKEGGELIRTPLSSSSKKIDNILIDVSTLTDYGVDNLIHHWSI